MDEMRHGNGMMRRSWRWENEDRWGDGKLVTWVQVKRRGDEMKKRRWMKGFRVKDGAKVVFRDKKGKQQEYISEHMKG